LNDSGLCVAIRLVLLPQNAMLLPRFPHVVAFNGEKYQKTRRKNKKNEIKMACYPIFFANFAEARKSLADSIMK